MAMQLLPPMRGPIGRLATRVGANKTCAGPRLRNARQVWFSTSASGGCGGMQEALSPCSVWSGAAFAAGASDPWTLWRMGALLQGGGASALLLAFGLRLGCAIASFALSSFVTWRSSLARAILWGIRPHHGGCSSWGASANMGCLWHRANKNTFFVS
eukprot:9660612-Alexandrium_andersonii.AAC.2